MAMPGHEAAGFAAREERPLSYADTLARESVRVLLAVLDPLHELLSIHTQHPCGSLLTADSVLTVLFSAIPENRDVHYKKPIADALDAIALVVTHSRLLTFHPKLKVEFWTLLLSSHAMQQDSETVETWMIEDKKFPSRVVLDFGGDRPEHLHEVVLNTIYTFMMTPPRKREDECALRWRAFRQEVSLMESRQLAFGLSFAQSNLTTECYHWIRYLCEQVAANPERQYTITSLNLSRNLMKAAHLEIVAALLTHREHYRLEEILLEEIVDKPLLPGSKATGLTKVLQAAFSADIHARTAFPSQPRAQNSVRFSRLSLAKNRLRAPHIVSICSALRYGCVIEQVSLASILNLVDPTERAECWRWLAFGLFYPRSKCVAPHFQLRAIDLLLSTLDRDSVKTFGSTLLNPAAEIRQRPDRLCSVVVCQVNAGAVVYSSPSTKSAPILVAKEQRDLEALYDDSDHEWTCVVVPGCGLGWVELDHIASMKRDLMDAGEWMCARYDLAINDVPYSFQRSFFLGPILQCVGPQLSSLELRDTGRIPIKIILEHCVNLQRLNFDGSNLRGGNILSVLTCRTFCSKLVSVNFNNSNLDRRECVALTAALGDPKRFPNLQELRMCQNRVSSRGLETLYNALRTNKKVISLEIGGTIDNTSRIEAMCVERAWLTVDCRDEILQWVPLTVTQKLAFLSVVTHANSAVRAGNSMDTWMFGTIFVFAECPLRRRLRWTNSQGGAVLC